MSLHRHEKVNQQSTEIVTCYDATPLGVFRFRLRALRCPYFPLFTQWQKVDSRSSRCRQNSDIPKLLLERRHQFLPFFRCAQSPAPLVLS